MANSDEQLLSILATLEECRAALLAGGNRDTAQLVSVAILELRMKLNRIGEAELKALCEEMLPDEESSNRPKVARPDAKPAPAPRRRPLLRLVK